MESNELLKEWKNTLRETGDAKHPEITVSYSSYAFAEENIPKLIKRVAKLEAILFDIHSRATRMNRANSNKRYLIWDLEYIAKTVLLAISEGQNNAKTK